MNIFERIQKSKAPMIMNLMHDEFEKRMWKTISLEDSVDLNDRKVDAEIRQYFNELRVICNYYNEPFEEFDNELEFIEQKQNFLIRIAGLDAEEKSLNLFKRERDIGKIDLELTQILAQYYLRKDEILEYYNLPEKEEEEDYEVEDDDE